MVVVLMCMIIFFTESLAECNGAVIWSNMPVGQLGIGDEHGVWVDYSEAVEKCIDAGGVIYNYNTAHDVYLKTHLSNLPLYHVAENSSTGMCTALGTNNVDVFVEDLHCRALPMFLCYQQGNFVWYDIPEGKIGIGDEHDVWLDYSEAVEKCISYGGMTYRYNPADDGFLKTHLSNFPLYHVYTSNSPSMCTALGTNNVDVVAGDLVCRTLPMFLCYQGNNGISYPCECLADPRVTSYDKVLKLITSSQKTIYSRGQNPNKKDKCKFQSRVVTSDDYPDKKGQVYIAWGTFSFGVHPKKPWKYERAVQIYENNIELKGHGIKKKKRQVTEFPWNYTTGQGVRVTLETNTAGDTFTITSPDCPWMYQFIRGGFDSKVYLGVGARFKPENNNGNQMGGICGNCDDVAEYRTCGNPGDDVSDKEDKYILISNSCQDGKH